MLTAGAFVLWECALRRGGLGPSRGPATGGGGLEARLDHGTGVRDLRIALADLGGGTITQGEGLREDEQMFRTPSARQRQRDCIRLLFATIVPQRGQTTRVTLARDKSADDALAGDACDSAQRLGPLDRHL